MQQSLYDVPFLGIKRIDGVDERLSHSLCVHKTGAKRADSDYVSHGNLSLFLQRAGEALLTPRGDRVKFDLIVVEVNSQIQRVI
jgi:hypothetical protein